MTSPDSLRAGRDSYAVALAGLIRDFGKHPNQIFALLEGKDADYYRPRIASVFAGSNAQISYRNLKGKKNEKLLIDAIKGNEGIKQLRYMAFFDRDYENDLQEIMRPEHYITPCYSIENLYTGSKSLKETIRALLYNDAAHDDDDAIIVDMLASDYEILQKEFHRSVYLFNCWAWAQRHFPRPGTLNLDSFEVEKHCEADFGQKTFSARYSLDDLNALASERSPVTAWEINQASAWFKLRHPVVSNRGKQEIAFLYWFIKLVIRAAEAGSSPFFKVIRCSKRVSLKEIISELGNYAETPSCLAEFLASQKKLLCGSDRSVVEQQPAL